MGRAVGNAIPTCLLEASGEAVGCLPGSWATRKWAISPWVGPRHLPGPLPHQPGHSRRVLLRQTRCSARLMDGVARATRCPAPHGPAVRRGSALVSRHLKALVTMAQRTPVGRVSTSMRSRTGATRRRPPGEGYVEELRGLPARGGSGRDGHRLGPLLRHGPRPALGAGRSWPTTRWCTAKDCAPPDASARHAGVVRAGRDGRVRPAHRGR